MTMCSGPVYVCTCPMCDRLNREMEIRQRWTTWEHQTVARQDPLNRLIQLLAQPGALTHEDHAELLDHRNRLRGIIDGTKPGTPADIVEELIDEIDDRIAGTSAATIASEWGEAIYYREMAEDLPSEVPQIRNALEREVCAETLRIAETALKKLDKVSDQPVDAIEELARSLRARLAEYDARPE